MVARQIALIVIALLSLTSTRAQLPEYRQYTSSNGLPSASVYDMLQDHEGYMWFATENGVCRFDGKSFQTYTTKDGLTENHVIGLFEDRQQRLWFLTLNGRLCYFRSGAISNPINDRFLGRLPALGAFHSVTDRPNGNVYIAFANHILILFADSFQTIAKVPMEAYGKNMAQEISGNVSLQGHTGILFDPNQPFVFNIGGNLIECSGNKFRYLDSSGEKHLRFEPFFQKIIGSDLWHTDFHLGISCIRNYRHKNRKAETYLNDVKVSRVYSDGETNLWFSTIGKGVFMIPADQLGVRHYNQKCGLAENDVRTLFVEAHKTLWIGSIQNSLYSLSSGRLKKYKIPTSLPGNISETNDICTDAAGQLYVCNVTDLVQFNGEPDEKHARIIKLLNADGSVAYGRNFKALTPGPGGSLLIASSHLCYVFNKKQNSGGPDLMTQVYRSQMARIYTIFSSHNHITWLADMNGLNRLGDKGIIPVWKSDSLLQQPVSRIREAPDGTLLLVTRSKGLLVYNGKKVLYAFTEKEGLASDICTRLFIDGSNVWVATAKGVSHLVYERGRLRLNRNYSTKDGLLSDEVNDVATINDTLYSASAEGVSIMPLSQGKPAAPPRLYFTGVQYGNQTLADTVNQVFQLSDNGLVINFTGITFQQPTQVQYSYRLVGADDQWKTNLSGNVEYASLAPGSYAFEVKAKKFNSGWSDPRVFHFIIQAPFWMEKWFSVLMYSSFFTGLISLIYFLSRRNRVRKLRRAELQSRIVQLEQQALGALMNPHFIFNALNSIQQYLNQNDTYQANKYLSLFARLTRKNMEAVMKSRVSIEDELERLKLYLHFEKLRFGEALHYEIKIPDELATDELALPPMILQPFVENAIWHGLLPLKGVGEVSVRIQLVGPNLIKVFVEDNGIGISQEFVNRDILLDKPDAHALNIIAQRLRLMNITGNHGLYIRFSHVHPEALRKGTLAEITIPVSGLS